MDKPIGEDERRWGPRGYDGAKKILGRNLQIAVDTLGLIHALRVHEASVQYRDGAKQGLVQLDRDRSPRLETVWADGAYQGALEDSAADGLGLGLQIVHKLRGQSGFVVLAKREIVERTLSSGSGATGGSARITRQIPGPPRRRSAAP